jgi:hypothetical protein
VSQSEPPKGDRRVRARPVTEVTDDMLEVRTGGSPEYVVRFLTAIEEYPTRPLLTLFASFDDDAKKLQRLHIWTSQIGIIFGSVALIAGIIQLALHSALEGAAWKTPLQKVELLSIILTVVAVGSGIVGKRHHRWLLARCNAEQLRLLKWRLLTDPLLPTRTPHDLETLIHDEIGTSLIPDIPLMEDTARKESPIAIPAERVAAVELRGLLDHYCDNRLAAQTAYFLKKSGDMDRSLFASPTLVPFFFLAAMALVCFHVGFEFLSHHTKQPASEVHDVISRTFLLGATIVPATWAGIRTWRAALEVTRNSMRAAAKHHALTAYQQRLRSHDIGATEAFGILACCEGLFAQEQGEWLRLMTEAESYT